MNTCVALTAATRLPKCTANCSASETITGAQKTFAWGRRADSFSRGSARDIHKKQQAINIPNTVICWSPCFTPLRVRSVKGGEGGKSQQAVNSSRAAAGCSEGRGPDRTPHLRYRKDNM